MLTFSNAYGNGEHFGFSHLQTPALSLGLIILAVLMGVIVFLVFLVKTKRIRFSYESDQY